LVAITMVYTAVAALGAFAWRKIPIELLPQTDLPRLTVTASYRGASPETTEAFLTSPLEASIQQVQGVEKINSTSREQNGVGQSTITVQFALDTDMNFARLELSERIATLEEGLPPGVFGVRVTPYVPEEIQRESTPFLTYNFTGP